MLRSISGLISVAMIGTLVFASLSPTTPESSAPHFDKLLHVFAYFVVCFWHSLLFTRFPGRVFVACVALGALLEILQGVTGYREASFADQIANTIGAAIALLSIRMTGIALFRDEPATH